MKTALTWMLCLVAISSHAQETYVASDATDAPLSAYAYQTGVDEKGIRIESHYLTMRDGVQLAIDVYLPKYLATDERVPTILFQTRYWRSLGFRWPFSMFFNKLDFNGAGKNYIKNFVGNGYAFVSVDVRGSGASTGVWHHPFHPDEILDGAEIVDWIIQQTWSDGKVGTFGRSYSGSAAEFTLINQHPAIKAAMPLYAPFDVFDDIGFPGGVHNSWYTTTWGKTNSLLDENSVPSDDWRAKLAVTGVGKVPGHGRVLKQAVSAHTANARIDEEAQKINFRDDAINQKIANIDVFSPYTHIDQINESGVPIYSYSGWMDGGYQHAAIKRYLNLESPHKKLIIGPWDHMGRHNASPANPGKTAFDHFSEVLKFFDFHLKGIDTGIYNEQPIHYFTMGEEKWKGSDQWPPSQMQQETFFLRTEGLLSTVAGQDSAICQVKVDTAFGVGSSTRWEALAGAAPPPPLYESSFKGKTNSLRFTTPTLTADTEVTGHPIVRLIARTQSSDLSVLIHLEDVDSSGQSIHVTEGHFRAIHRKVMQRPMYKDVVPHHSYLKEDQKPLVPNQWMELTFDLLPTSYLFRKGHRIQLLITTRDQDHFQHYNQGAQIIEFMINSNAGSSLILPMKNNN